MPRYRRHSRPYKSECKSIHPLFYPGEPVKNYLDWDDWAEKMSKTHTQKFCSHCERWAIWEPKEN